LLCTSFAFLTTALLTRCFSINFGALRHLTFNLNPVSFLSMHHFFPPVPPSAPVAVLALFGGGGQSGVPRRLQQLAAVGWLLSMLPSNFCAGRGSNVHFYSIILTQTRGKPNFCACRGLNVLGTSSMHPHQPKRSHATQAGWSWARRPGKKDSCKQKKVTATSATAKSMAALRRQKEFGRKDLG